jgi:hypothetical protein
MASESLEPRVLLSSYFVSTSGDDGNPGTLGAPFRTIQQAANVADAGDTVFIRGGTYRETVRPAHLGTSSNPITFAPYDNETVTVSGADVITGWSDYSGDIYRARQGWDLGAGDNQVFVDGRMMIEARWPNTTLDVSQPKLATADALSATINGARSKADLRDAALTQADGYWDGATIHIAPGEAWVTQTATVTDYSKGRLQFTYQQMNERYEVPEKGDRYYLTGKFQALDAAGEWFHDPDGSLYLWAPDGASPSQHTVEAKRRDLAFDLRGRSGVRVDSVNLFAATIATDGGSDSITLTGLDARYVSHYSVMPTGWTRPDTTGVYLLGTRSVLRDSVIAFSAGHGVAVGGRGNRVENVTVHDVGYAGANDAGINVRGPGHVITRTTVYNTGRSGIKIGYATDFRITHNLIHDVMLQTTDGGGIYTYGTDARGGEIAYNVIYNSRSGGFGAVGVYLDNFSSNYVIHHNVVWNADHALKMNPTSRDNVIYNNTLAGVDYSVATSKSGDMLGSVFRNNIFTKAAKIDPRATKQNNLNAGTDPGFVDLAGGDLRLKSTSRAIDAGIALGIATAGYAGDAPDAGAYEYGKTPWTAGADLSSPVRPAPRPTPSPTPAPTGGNPRAWTQAENFTSQSGGVRKGKTIIGYLDGGDWVRYGPLDFANGTLRSFTARLAVAAGWQGKQIQLRLDSPTGRLIGTLTTRSTGTWDRREEQSALIDRVTGVHTLYLVFAGGAGVATVDAFKFA